jgi:hypothetical protein
MSVKSAALNSLQLTIGRWQNPSAWDRVVQDEPLDPLPGQWVGDTATNLTATGAITIPIGTTFVNGIGDTFRVTSLHQNHTQFSMGCVASNLVHRNGPSDTQFNSLPGEPTTGNPYGNGPPALPMHPSLPYPRNHHERRILKSIDRKLGRLIQRARQKFGPPEPGAIEEWNDKFWKMVSHAGTAFEDRRKIKK